jgi:MerR family transcriptional regulator, copper efflux regulator
VEQIGDLLALWRDRSRASADVKRLALEHVAELERKAAELQAMSRTLSSLAARCHGDDRPDCPIVDDLAEAAGTKGRPARGRSSGTAAPRFGPERSPVTRRRGRGRLTQAEPTARGS